MKRGLYEIPCASCGKMFLPKQSVTRACSRACGYKYRTTRIKGIPIGPRTDPIQRFWDKVEKTEGCWYWRGTLTAQRYGVFKLNGKMIGAHRLSYELTYGVSLGDAWGCHDCDTPNCVRPDHITPGDATYNNRDRSRKGRNNAPRGEDRPNTKVTAAQVREMRARFAAGGVTCTQLARDYGILPSNARQIISGRRWKGVV